MRRLLFFAAENASMMLPMKQEPFQSTEVAAIFADYSANIRRRLLELRQLIFDTARETQGVGKIEETIRWGQPSYITAQSGSGTTIRLDKVKNKLGHLAIYVHCQTSLIDDFRNKYGNALNFETNRAIHFSEREALPAKKLGEFIRAALTYHLRKKP